MWLTGHFPIFVVFYFFLSPANPRVFFLWFLNQTDRPTWQRPEGFLFGRWQASWIKEVLYLKGEALEFKFQLFMILLAKLCNQKKPSLSQKNPETFQWHILKQWSPAQQKQSMNCVGDHVSLFRNYEISPFFQSVSSCQRKNTTQPANTTTAPATNLVTFANPPGQATETLLSAPPPNATLCQKEGLKPQGIIGGSFFVDNHLIRPSCLLAFFLRGLLFALGGYP